MGRYPADLIEAREKTVLNPEVMNENPGSVRIVNG